LIASHEGIDDVPRLARRSRFNVQKFKVRSRKEKISVILRAVERNKYAYADHIARGLGVDFLKDVTRQQKTRIARMHSW
jgi:hypothetical protein